MVFHLLQGNHVDLDELRNSHKTLMKFHSKLLWGGFGSYLEFLLYCKAYFVRSGQKIKLRCQVTSYFNVQEVKIIFLYLEYSNKPLNIHNLFVRKSANGHLVFLPWLSVLILTELGERMDTCNSCRSCGWDVAQNPHRSMRYLPSSPVAPFLNKLLSEGVSIGWQWVIGTTCHQAKAEVRT